MHLNLSLYLTQYLPTNPVSAVPILSAHCLLPLVLSSRLLPPPIDIDIALYLHKSTRTSHHEHSYSKCALADSSFIVSFLSNYDRSWVHSRCCSTQFYRCYYSSYEFSNSPSTIRQYKFPTVFSYIDLLCGER